jgi:hypothetical protein
MQKKECSRPKREHLFFDDGYAASLLHILTASFNPFPAENFGAFEAAIITGCPVRGFLPSRAFRSTTVNVPKPINFTSSPCFKAPVMISNVASTALAASVLVMRDVSATALINSFFVIGSIPLLDLKESPAQAGHRAKLSTG